jgi:hypothetical protein
VPKIATNVDHSSLLCGMVGTRVARATCPQSAPTANAVNGYAKSASTSHLSTLAIWRYCSRTVAHEIRSANATIHSFAFILNSISAASAMPARSAPMLIGVLRKQRWEECDQHPAWKAPTEISGQAFPGHLTDTGTHHLNGGHHRPGYERSPKKLRSKLRACNRICGDPRRVIVGGTGDDPRTKRLQQLSHPSRWPRLMHDRTGAHPCKLRSRVRSESYTSATRAERSKRSNLNRHRPDDILDAAL